jgi:hypothetical protein
MLKAKRELMIAELMIVTDEILNDGTKSIQDFRIGCERLFAEIPFSSTSETIGDLVQEIIEVLGISTIYGGMDVLDKYVIDRINALDTEALDAIRTVLNDDNIQTLPPHVALQARYLAKAIS